MKNILIVLLFSICLLAVNCQAYFEIQPPDVSPVITESYTTNYFFVASNQAPFSVKAGEDVEVLFTISNDKFLSPKNVTAYFSPCPEGWKCGYDTFSFNKTGIHPVSLKLGVPQDAAIDKYTIYILLDSEWRTARGVDRIIVMVLPTDKKELPPTEIGDVEIPTENPVEDLTPLEEETPPEDDIAPEDTGLDAVTGHIVALPQENNSDNSGNDTQQGSGNILDYIILGWVVVGVIVGAIFFFKKK
jgi:hypothetical protein